MRDRQALSKVEAWAGKHTLRDIEVMDSSRYLFGKEEDRWMGDFEIDVKGEETVTELTIRGNGVGTRCGAFKIVINRNRTYFPQMYDWGSKTAYPKPVGSGIIIGCLANHGSDIDALGFLMLRNVIGVDTIDIVYPLSDSNFQPPPKKIPLDVTKGNSSDKDSDTGSFKVRKNHGFGGSWSTTTGVTFGQTY